MAQRQLDIPMSCDLQELTSSASRWERITRKAYEYRIPLFGGMDLTARCNLQCVHCYINTPAARKKPRPECPTARIHTLIDEIADAGCLFFTLTGGEPLLHKDFIDIYRHLKRRGIETYIFTNGTLISEEHIALFRELPPFAIQLSLYGATRETYERVTGVAGSFEICLAGIHRLAQTRIPLTLTTPLLTLNRHEVPALRQMARDFGCSFKLNPEIHATLCGDDSPTRLRLPADEAVALEAEAPEAVRQWRAKASQPRTTTCAPDALFECPAGSSKFHITPDGILRPCSLIQDPKYATDLTTISFAEAWNGAMTEIKNIKKPENFPCYSCNVKEFCAYCPAKRDAFHDLKSGQQKQNLPRPYSCSVATCKWTIVQRWT